VVDLRPVAATTAALADVQQVIHLASIADETPFPELLQTNILATFTCSRLRVGTRSAE
jgi:hypothetical protein